MADFENQKIIPVALEKEMKKSYIDYAMSVIVGRALPDVRDGLKPVHRRILYTMHESGLDPSKPHRKCADTVGSVLGRYHPHGDASVYDALVRMAQDFSLRYPLVDGHGNFGSVDGDSPAAYRYTEARMSKLSTFLLADIDKETVDFAANYDERLQEPTVLPSRFPNLLVNGSAGIAVGMATNIPPHNLTEVINGITALIDNPEITIDELMQYIKGPDFPTYGQILGKSGIRAAYHTGRGKVVMRARCEIETNAKGRTQIIVTELPYQVNKARLQEKIAEMVKDKRIDGIAAMDDFSDREGMRLVIDVKQGANANVVLNNLYKHSQLQESFGIINLALVNGQPKVMDLKTLLVEYVNFQKEVITRRAIFDKKKAEARAHILEGYRIALDNIDEVIRIIRESYDSAKQDLMAKFGFSDIQAQAILDMQLKRLQGLEREKIDDEYNKLMELIAYLESLLADENKVLGVIKDELAELKAKHGDERRTEILAVDNEIDDEDLIPEEECVITLTHFGYIKRTTADTYRTQKRGGRGVAGLATREEDFVEHMFVGSSHSYILFFTDKGRVYRMKGYEIAEAGRNARGMAIVNLLELDAEETVTAMVPIPREVEGYLTMVTRGGVVKRTELDKYMTSRRGGVNGIVLDEGDVLVGVQLTDGQNDVILATNQGMAIRFSEDEVRASGRVSRGVRGIRLKKDDYIVGMAISNTGMVSSGDGAANSSGDGAASGSGDGVVNGSGDGAANGSGGMSGEATVQHLLAVTEGGYGKRTGVGEYRKQSRGGMGTRVTKMTADTGAVASVKVVTDDDDIMLITSEGVIIRMDSAQVRSVGRVSRGVRLVRLGEDVRVIGASVIKKDNDDDSEEDTTE